MICTSKGISGLKRASLVLRRNCYSRVNSKLCLVKGRMFSRELVRNLLWKDVVRSSIDSDFTSVNVGLEGYGDSPIVFNMRMVPTIRNGELFMDSLGVPNFLGTPFTAVTERMSSNQHFFLSSLSDKRGMCIVDLLRKTSVGLVFNEEASSFTLGEPESISSVEPGVYSNAEAVFLVLSEGSAPIKRPWSLLGSSHTLPYVSEGFSSSFLFTPAHLVQDLYLGGSVVRRVSFSAPVSHSSQMAGKTKNQNAIPMRNYPNRVKYHHLTNPIRRDSKLFTQGNAMKELRRVSDEYPRSWDAFMIGNYQFTGDYNSEMTLLFRLSVPLRLT